MQNPLRTALTTTALTATALTAAAVATVAATAAPAFAAPTQTTHVAAAGWVETVKGVADNVAVQAVQAPGQAPTLYMLIGETYCDTFANRTVEIAYYSPAVAISGTLRIDPADNAATLDTAIALTGTKTTFAGCTGVPQGTITTTVLRPVVASIDVAWVATGPGRIGGGGISRPATAGGYLRGHGALASVPLAPTVASLTAISG